MGGWKGWNQLEWQGVRERPNNARIKWEGAGAKAINDQGVVGRVDEIAAELEAEEPIWLGLQGGALERMRMEGGDELCERAKAAGWREGRCPKDSYLTKERTGGNVGFEECL